MDVVVEWFLVKIGDAKRIEAGDYRAGRARVAMPDRPRETRPLRSVLHLAGATGAAGLAFRLGRRSA